MVVLTLLPHGSFQVRRIHVPTNGTPRIAYREQPANGCVILLTLLYASLILAGGMYLMEGAAFQQVREQISARLKAADLSHNFANTGSKIHFAGGNPLFGDFPNGTGLAQNKVGTAPLTEQAVNLTKMGEVVLDARHLQEQKAYGVFLLDCRSGLEITQFVTCSSSLPAVEGPTTLSYQTGLTVPILRTVGSAVPVSGDGKVYALLEQEHTSEIFEVIWLLRAPSGSTYGPVCLAEGENSKLAYQSSSTVVAASCQWTALCKRDGYPYILDDAGNIQDLLAVRRLQEQGREHHEVKGKESSTTGKRLAPTSTSTTGASTHALRKHSTSSTTTVQVLKEKKTATERTTILASTTAVELAAPDADTHVRKNDLCAKLSAGCVVPIPILMHNCAFYCGDNISTCAEAVGPHFDLVDVYAKGLQTSVLKGKGRHSCEHVLLKAVDEGLVDFSPDCHPSCERFQKDLENEVRDAEKEAYDKILEKSGYGDSAGEERSKSQTEARDGAGDHSKGGSDASGHEQRQKQEHHTHAKQQDGDYADHYSCKHCMADDNCPISYRWWCQSSSATSWFHGFTMLTVLLNIIIIAFPMVVLAFGLSGYTGHRARTRLGAGVLWATDYFRAALALSFVLFLCTNLLHSPNQEKTVLDVQYANPRLTNYIGAWLTLDTIATAIILDIGTAYCHGDPQDELVDYVMCSGGSGLSWLYTFASVVTLCQVLILAGAPPPSN
eukprot:s2052_g4.t1